MNLATAKAILNLEAKLEEARAETEALQKRLEEMQGDLMCAKYLGGKVMNAHLSEPQKQLGEMRGDLMELLADIGEWDEYTPVVKKMRAKYLEVKS